MVVARSSAPLRDGVDHAAELVGAAVDDDRDLECQKPRRGVVSGHLHQVLERGDQRRGAVRRRQTGQVARVRGAVGVVIGEGVAS